MSSDHPDSLGFGTRAVHAGLTPDPSYRLGDPGDPPDLHLPRSRARATFVEDYDYSRSANPTRKALEDALGALEGGLAVAFSSGLAAEHAVITATCKAGAHIVLAGRPLRRHLPPDRQGADELGPELHHGRPDRPGGAGRARSHDETRLIWVETPTNPRLDVVDIKQVVAAKRHALVAVDNTFATPANQNPLADGADFVVHSTTKYLGGHSDVVGGAVITGRPGLLRAAALHPELGRRRARPVRLLPRAPRPAHAAPAYGGPRAAAPLLWSSCSSEIPDASDVRWPGFSGMVSFRHPRARGDRVAHQAVHARRVARRRRVADRGAAGDDAPVGRGLEPPPCRPTWSASAAGSRILRTSSPTCARRSLLEPASAELEQLADLGVRGGAEVAVPEPDRHERVGCAGADDRVRVAPPAPRRSARPRSAPPRRRCPPRVRAAPAPPRAWSRRSPARRRPRSRCGPAHRLPDGHRGRATRGDRVRAFRGGDPLDRRGVQTGLGDDVVVQHAHTPACDRAEREFLAPGDPELAHQERVQRRLD